MSDSPYLDPLEAAQSLLIHIAGRDGTTANLTTLAEHLDAFMYSLRFVRNDSVARTPECENDRHENSYESWRSVIGSRFPTLGFYWIVLSSCITKDAPEIATGDAIDDLADIAVELENVETRLKSFGRQDALSAIREAYETHLYMHIVPLRNHLEELQFE